MIPSWTLFGATIEDANSGDSFVVDPIEILGDMMKFKKSREIEIDISDKGIEITDNAETRFHTLLSRNRLQ